MQERLVAFFATREAAEEAAAVLRRAYSPEPDVQILQAEEGASFAPKDSRSAKRRRETPDFMDRVRGLLAEIGLLDARRAATLDDTGRNCFEEGLCRGGVVLRVEVDAEQAQESMNLLARHEALDVTEYATGWARLRKRHAGGQDAGTAPQKAATRTRTAKAEPAGEKGGRGRTPKVASDPAIGNAVSNDHGHEITPEMRERMIAEEAYFLAEQRGFAGDLAVEDWLEAERLVDARLNAARADGSGTGA